MASPHEHSVDHIAPAERAMRVCFVVLDAFPAIDPRVEGGIGGIETRSWMLARSLAKSDDFEVSFMIRHPRKILHTDYHGVRILPVYDRSYLLRTEVSRKITRKSGFPWLGVKEFSWKLLWQLPLLMWSQWKHPKTHSREIIPEQLSTYLALDADVLICFGVNRVSATVIASARASGKRSMLFVASDIDLDERYTAYSDYVNIYHCPAKTCHYAVTNADQVIVQTSKQLELLKRNFERSGELIGNPIDLEEWDERLRSAEFPVELGELDHYVLWVGRAERNQKQPQLMPELARMCPEIPFVMVMNPSDEELERQVRRDAPRNLQIVDKIPFAQMPAVYRNASVLVNTSSSEGFPNTFLQAAASGVPIASLHVAEDFLKASGAGQCVGGSLEKMAELLQRWSAKEDGIDPALARRYVADHHSLSSQVGRVSQTLLHMSPFSHK